MAKIDLHKLALTVGFEVVCVDDDYTSYEYMVRLNGIESVSYVLQIKNKINYTDVDNILQSIVLVLPTRLRLKVKRLARKKDENNIDNIIDLLCFTISEYQAKTKYHLLKEYGDLVGVDIEKQGYFFSYKMSNKKFYEILALIESKLELNDALVLGKIKKIEYKIGYMKQNKKAVI